MRNVLLTICALAFASQSFATTTSVSEVNPINYTVDAAGVEKVVTVGVGVNDQTEYRHKIIVVDHGLSTDLSPRYGIYYAYQMVSEMANPSVMYNIGNVMDYSSIKRESAGVYSIVVKTLDYQDDDFVSEKLVINAGNIQQEVESQVGDFEDGAQGDTLKLTPLILKTTVVKK
jgi:hypothetical protein